MRGRNPVFSTQFGEADALGERNAACTPCVETLAAQTEPFSDDSATELVNQGAISVSMSRKHDTTVNAAFANSNTETLIEINNDPPSTADMGDLAKTVSERIRARMEERSVKPADLARSVGYTPQRLNNYIHEKTPRLPDVESLVKIAQALKTTPDALLDLNEVTPQDVNHLVEAVPPAVLRLLELEGLALERAEAIAHVVQKVLLVLAAFPSDGFDPNQSRQVAQTAWQLEQHSKLS